MRAYLAMPLVALLSTAAVAVPPPHRQHARSLALGAQLRLDRRNSPDEPLYAYADPSGHPFCIFVA